jgi:predicted alpha/beta superfamily hydrolase
MGRYALPPSTFSPAEIAGGAKQFDLRSQLSGRTFRIFVYKPAHPPLGQKYPTFYTTDGNVHFALAAMQMFGGAKFCYRPAIVVGIGYPNSDYTALMGESAGRFFDFTPATDPDQLPAIIAKGKSDKYFGGAELFFRFINEELRPQLVRQFPIDVDDETLFGHSLGGLFSLITLFKHPGSFRNFIASSPSIWWGKRQVLDLVPTFRKTVRTGAAAPRILIEVGGLEQNPIGPRYGISQLEIASYNRLVDHWRMVANARQLVRQLSRIKGQREYTVRFRLHAEEDHVSVLPRSITSALKFALGDDSIASLQEVE